MMMLDSFYKTHLQLCSHSHILILFATMRWKRGIMRKLRKQKRQFMLNFLLRKWVMKPSITMLNKVYVEGSWKFFFFLLNCLIFYSLFFIVKWKGFSWYVSTIKSFITFNFFFAKTSLSHQKSFPNTKNFSQKRGKKKKIDVWAAS